MIALRVLLVGFLVGILGYTFVAVGNDGINFPLIAINNVMALGWTGQFHLDFVCYLILSALWVGWRHRFSGPGLGLAALASVGGIIFLSVYLLVLSRQVANFEELLIGDRGMSK